MSYEATGLPAAEALQYHSSASLVCPQLPIPGHHRLQYLPVPFLSSTRLERSCRYHFSCGWNRRWQRGLRGWEVCVLPTAPASLLVPSERLSKGTSEKMQNELARRYL